MTFTGIEDSTPSLEETLSTASPILLVPLIIPQEAPSKHETNKRKQEDESHWSDPKKTTSVYVTGNFVCKNHTLMIIFGF